MPSPSAVGCAVASYAAAGCTVDPFGAPGSLWEAPHGGYFDVVAAVAELVPVPPESAD